MYLSATVCNDYCASLSAGVNLRPPLCVSLPFGMLRTCDFVLYYECP